jgi:hypothetical protein
MVCPFAFTRIYFNKCCRFGDMQTKLKATAEEFENSRKEAKNAKELFLAIKNER